MKKKHCTPSEKRRWLRRQRASGLSIAAFARLHGLPVGTLYKWRKDFPEPSGPVELIELAGSPRTEHAYCELTLRGGRRLKFPATLAPKHVGALADALEESS